MFGFRKNRKAPKQVLSPEADAQAYTAAQYYVLANKAAARANSYAAQATQAIAEGDEEMLDTLREAFEAAKNVTFFALSKADAIEVELIWSLPTAPEPSRKV